MFDRINTWIWIVIIILLEVLWLHSIQVKMEKELEASEIYNKKTIKLHNILSKDLQCFPIAVHYIDNINFQDTFHADREQGLHEGCDILFDEDVAGVVPIVSATDGTITNLGWLHLGGYRVGITSENGIYYYYAHFDTYSPGLYVGKQISAGEFLGFMGNTGEGPEGTEGNFPVHLHFGIYVRDNNENEEAINPYPYLIKINQE